MNHTQSAMPAREGRSGFLIALRLGLVFIILCGIAYPLVCTGLAQLFMKSNADGSLIRDANGTVIGSSLIGQKVDDPRLFQNRVSSIEYKAEASGSNNYGPSNEDLLQRAKDSIAEWEKNNPSVPVAKVPIALLTNSGSGLDPHITPRSAEVQIPRISRLTGIPAQELEQLIGRHTEGRSLGLFGEPRVNVLELNLELAEKMSE